MKPFTFRHGAGPWPPGVTILHVYAIPDLAVDTALSALVRQGQAAVSGLPVTPVPAEWLHVTIDQVTGATADTVPQRERDELAGALTDELARADPLTVVAGSMLSYASGVICDLSPDDGIADLHRRVRSVLRTVRGPEACQYEWGVQHLTIGYAYGEADSDQAQRLLRRVRPSHAPLQIDAVHVVDVRADHDARQITWEHLARIPLGRGTAA